ASAGTAHTASASAHAPLRAHRHPRVVMCDPVRGRRLYQTAAVTPVTGGFATIFPDGSGVGTGPLPRPVRGAAGRWRQDRASPAPHHNRQGLLAAVVRQLADDLVAGCLE